MFNKLVYLTTQQD